MSGGVGITARQIAVIQEVARGASNQEIAIKMHVTKSGVKNLLSELYSKLGIGGDYNYTYTQKRVVLAILAWKLGLVEQK